MNQLVKKVLLMAFAWAVGMLFAASPVLAQAPAPPTVINNYAAKFICGVHPELGINAVVDAQPGRYASKINVHNNTGIDIAFRKKVIPLKGGQNPTEPAFRKFEALKPDYAMEVVCKDIYGHLGIVIGPNQPPPYIEGFVIFEVYFNQPFPQPLPRDPLDVEGIYTYFGSPFSQGVSIDVEVFPAKFNSHLMVP